MLPEVPEKCKLHFFKNCRNCNLQFSGPKSIYPRNSEKHWKTMKKTQLAKNTPRSRSLFWLAVDSGHCNFFLLFSIWFLVSFENCSLEILFELFWFSNFWKDQGNPWKSPRSGIDVSRTISRNAEVSNKWSRIFFCGIFYNINLDFIWKLFKKIFMGKFSQNFSTGTPWARLGLHLVLGDSAERSPGKNSMGSRSCTEGTFPKKFLWKVMK